MPTQFTVTVSILGVRKRAKYVSTYRERIGSYSTKVMPQGLVTDEVYNRAVQITKRAMKSWKRVIVEFRHETIVNHGGVEFIEAAYVDPLHLQVPIEVVDKS